MIVLFVWKYQLKLGVLESLSPTPLNHICSSMCGGWAKPKWRVTDSVPKLSSQGLAVNTDVYWLPWLRSCCLTAAVSHCHNAPIVSLQGSSHHVHLMAICWPTAMAQMDLESLVLTFGIVSQERQQMIIIDTPCWCHFMALGNEWPCEIPFGFSSSFTFALTFLLLRNLWIACGCREPLWSMRSASCQLNSLFPSLRSLPSFNGQPMECYPWRLRFPDLLPGS